MAGETLRHCSNRLWLRGQVETKATVDLQIDQTRRADQTRSVNHKACIPIPSRAPMLDPGDVSSPQRQICVNQLVRDHASGVEDLREWLVVHDRVMASATANAAAREHGAAAPKERTVNGEVVGSGDGHPSSTTPASWPL